MSEAILVTRELSVRYGRRQALHRVTASFAGGCLGLLGPNGAGKSSMLRAILGLLSPSEGEVRVFGIDTARDPRRVRANVGYMPERDCHVPALTGLEFVTYCGRLAGLDKATARRRSHEVLAYVGLAEERYRPVEGYSRGMKQRAKFAAALVHDPGLLFLDEPTNGLDPRARHEFLALVRDLTRVKNVHVVLSSHLLQDVEQVADTVLVLAAGEVRASGRLEDLLGEDRGGYVVRVSGDPESFARHVREAGLTLARDARNQSVVRPAPGAGPISVADVFRVARAAGTPLREIQPLEETLEDIFLRALDDPPRRVAEPLARESGAR